jgi:valyl-tRNA synthetase
MKPLAEPALAAYRTGELRFHPEHFGNTYSHWLENVRDWPISRQLWWGHRIPVWYCQNGECGATIVLRDDPECCPDCGGALVQDPDVLDTWFSSWLWPFSTLGWPEQTPDLDVFYPTATLITAADILFFWVARMVMAGLEFMGELPFTDVVINGTVRDHLGRRMSKSLGNGIDPVEVIDRFGADAMRFTLVHSAPIGTDLLLNYEDLDATFRVGRNFANKMWNAVRFALPLLSEADADVDLETVSMELSDRWILSRLHTATAESTASLERFRFDEAAEATYQFVWSEFADWYLELIKPRMYGDRGESSRAAAAATLWHVLDGWLRLLHPAMPFITEELATRLPGRSEEFTLMFGPWPAPPDAWKDPAAERQMDALQELVGAVRNLRAEYNVQPGTRVDVHIASPSEALQGALVAESDGVRVLARVGELVESGTASDGDPGAHAVLRGGGELFIPLSAVIDVAKERLRLQGELQRVQQLLEGTRKKLSNEKFLGNAPAEVVQREREKESSLQEQYSRLSEKRGALGE